MFSGLLCIRDMNPDDKELQTLDMPFSTPSSTGVDVPLSSSHRKVTLQNREEFIRLALDYRYLNCFIAKLIILIRVTVIEDVGRVGVQLVGKMGIHVGLG